MPAFYLGTVAELRQILQTPYLPFRTTFVNGVMNIARARSHEDEPRVLDSLP